MVIMRSRAYPPSGEMSPVQMLDRLRVEARRVTAHGIKQERHINPCTPR